MPFILSLFLLIVSCKKANKESIGPIVPKPVFSFHEKSRGYADFKKDGKQLKQNKGGNEGMNVFSHLGNQAEKNSGMNAVENLETWDFGDVSLDSGIVSNYAFKRFSMNFPSSTLLLSVHRSCSCVGVSLLLSNGKFLPLRKPFLPLKIPEPGRKVIRVRLRKPEGTKRLKGQIAFVFQNGKTKLVKFRCFFKNEFSFYPKKWDIKAEELHPKIQFEIKATRPYTILSLFRPPPGLVARIFPKDSTRTLWVAKLKYIGHSPLPDHGILTFSVNGGRRFEIPWKRLSKPDIRLRPAPFLFLSRLRLFEKRKKKIWIEGLDVGERVISVLVFPQSSPKVQIDVKPVPSSFSKNRSASSFLLSIKNLALLKGESVEGSVEFSLLRKGGMRDSISLEILCMGGE